MDQQLRDFIATCGRMPDPHSPLPAEAALALRTGSMGHQHVVTDLTVLRVQHIWTHLLVQGEMPATTSRNAYEAKLGVWLDHGRQRGLADEHEALLDRVVPGWRTPREARWEQRMRMILEHHRKHGRLPSRNLGTVKERQLAQWFADQLRLDRSGRLAPTRSAMLAEANGMMMPTAVAA